jgi:hypothetical protein
MTCWAFIKKDWRKTMRKSSFISLFLILALFAPFSFSHAEEMPAPEAKPLVPVKGTLNTYRVVKQGGPKQAALGFGTYLDLVKSEAEHFIEGDLVKLQPTEGRFTLVRSTGPDTDLYNYKARLLEVTGGDSLSVLVELGYGITTKQQVRLRGIEAKSPEAKAFVEKTIKTATIYINSSPEPKDGVYTVDLFYKVPAGAQAASAEKGIAYLNQELLSHGHAVRTQD